MKSASIDRSISMLVAALLSLLFVAHRASETSSFFFEVTMTSSTAGIAQLFFDAGHGINESDSARFQITAPDATTTHRFPLPEGVYPQLRFDPIDREGRVTVSHLKILRPNFWGGRREVVSSIEASQFQIVNDIASLERNGDSARIITAEHATDPIVVIQFDPPLSLHVGTQQKVINYGFAFFGLTALIWLVFWLSGKAYARLEGELALLWSQISSWAQSNPKRAIASIALVAALVSSYPVAFCGMSFISPNHGATLLYDKYPTLPGYTSTVLENVRGADVGAVMWAHFPYSVVESRAIFNDGELPLWNRFNSTGVTLLGQGQSMLGDPLNIGVLLAGAASWAWDVKYVLSKMLFALGLGLIVFCTTRHLPSALIVAFSSAYLGFFAYRFNHPAIFSMTYAPWILFAWVRFSLVSPENKSSVAVPLAGLVFANWCVMNSGTAKEAYMLLICLNFTGFLIFVLEREAYRFKIWKGSRMVFAQVLFVAISAPVWFTFLEAIKNSYSSYTTPAANQISPGLFIGLFDDIFYRQIVPGEGVYAPSMNFVFFIGFAWAMIRFRQLATNPAFVAICVGSIIPFCLAFGVIPSAIITTIPFLRNVIHVGNTFSVVLIIHLVLIAGFGWQALLTWKPSDSRWRIEMLVMAALLTALLGIYFHAAADAYKDPSFWRYGFSPFFWRYGLTLIAASLMIPWLLRILARGSLRRGVVVLLLILCAIALQWRHGMYLKSWTEKDGYVMNPQVRVDLTPPSPAIQFIEHESHEPFRVVGFDGNLFPGYNAALGIEGISGPDALMNPFYRELTQALPFEWGWGWRIVVPKSAISALHPFLDFMNVGFYVDLPGKATPTPGLTPSGTFDLAVFRSETAWPRAFFTDSVSVYSSVPELVDMIARGAGHPFAAVQNTELADVPVLRQFVRSAKNSPLAATNYKLTNNTTAFSIAAPGPGLIVLSEAFSSNDFSVTLNGAPVTYFRTNHAFKAVVVGSAGKYDVRFVYRPQYLSEMLAVGGLGLLVLIVWLATGLFRRSSIKAQR